MTFEPVRVGADGGPPKMDHTDLYTVGRVKRDDPYGINASQPRGCNATHCREHSEPPARERPDLDKTRAALRREIGPVGSESSRGGWGPMVAAYEVDDLLLALDDVDNLRSVLRAEMPGWDGTPEHLSSILVRLR
jgi:hypothetical protein